MTPLRQRMIDAMVLRGFSARTQETYLTAVSQLARHHHRSPGLHSISKLLGHAQLSTTSRYLRMARPGHSAGAGALALLSQLPKPPQSSPPPPTTPSAPPRH